MPTLKESMGSVEIAAAVAELRALLIDSFVDNIYDLSDQAFLIRVRKSGKTFEVVLEAGKRVHLTGYHLPRRPKPSGFCSFLRRHILGGRVRAIEQRDFDRVAFLEVSTKGGAYRLVVELFEKGNVVLVNPQGLVEGALFYRRMRDRSIIPKAPFQYPPMAGLDPRKVEARDLEALKRLEGVEVIRALARVLGLRTPYSDEALAQAGIDAKKPSSLLEDGELKRLYEALQTQAERLDTLPYDASIVYDAEGRLLDVVPFPLRVYEGLPRKGFQSFNEALDEFFTTLEIQGFSAKEGRKVQRRLEELRRILEGQRERVERLKEDAEASRKLGDIIMRNLPTLEELFQGLIEERRFGRPWEETIRRLEELRNSGRAAFQVPLKVFPERHSVSITLEGVSFNLDLLKTPQENAEAYYRRSKEARRKLEGLLRAIAETEERMRKLEPKVEEVPAPLLPKKRGGKAWYEAFHHFFSSDGFLVLAGKDAISNETLFRRHMEPQDLVLHADFPGASFVLVKTGGKEVPERTLGEAAVFAACHSKAWSLGLASATVFYVKPEQVSKSAPTGQFLRRGAFMIRGSKSFIRSVPLRLAIGVKVEEGRPSVVAGPREAVSSRTDAYLEIVPGNKSSRQLAEELRSRLLEALVKKGLKVTMTDLSIEGLQEPLPAGKGDLAI